MWLKYLLGIGLFLVSQTPLGWAESLRVGLVYTREPGIVSVVVELPPGVSPTAADFHLRIDDNPVATAQQIRPFRDSGQGMALAVCIDVSGTMARGPIDEAKKALLAFLTGARPEDRIALISFADAEEIESSFAETRGHHTEAVRDLKTRGNKTRLYQTIYKTLDIFEDPSLPKRRRIVVISDGKDEGSLQGAADVINKANKRGIPIDAVGRGRIEEQYAEALRGLSNSTGGYFEHARRDMRTATDALAAIYEKLSHALVIDFQYVADDSGRMAQNAWIELQRRDQPPWRVAIPEAIPQVIIQQSGSAQIAEQTSGTATTTDTATTSYTATTTVPGPEPFRLPDWVWLFLAVLLVVSLVGWVRWAQGPKEADQTSGVAHLPLTEFDHESSRPVAEAVELPPRTQVGGYHFPAPGPEQPTAVLLGVSGPMQGQRFLLDKELVHIGAHPDNDLSIAGDEYLSGNHAYLLYKQGSLFLFDKGSTNGTFVNRQAVTATGFALSLGDHIQIGTSAFELVRGAS